MDNETLILVPYSSISASPVRNSITRFPSNISTSQTRRTELQRKLAEYIEEHSPPYDATMDKNYIDIYNQYLLTRKLNLTTFPRKHIDIYGKEPRSRKPCHLHSQVIKMTDCSRKNKELRETFHASSNESN